MTDNHPTYQYESDFERFLQCVSQATLRIRGKYMLLPIDGLPLPIYRERVYCYELYHQLRLQMGDDFGYYLGGEVDKTNHPRMNHPILKNTKPDLLVHDPGRMEGNLVAIEVKPVKKQIKGNRFTIPAIEKDLKTLTAFRSHGQYYKAIYLIYGDDQQKFRDIKRKALRLQGVFADDINLNLIDLYWHRRPRESAIREDWE